MTVQMTEEERADMINHIGAITGTASGIQMIAVLLKDEALKGFAEMVEYHGWEILRMIDPAEFERVKGVMGEDMPNK